MCAHRRCVGKSGHIGQGLGVGEDRGPLVPDAGNGPAEPGRHVEDRLGGVECAGLALVRVFALGIVVVEGALILAKAHQDWSYVDRALGRFREDVRNAVGAVR